MLNDKVFPFYREQDVELLGILTDRETEYCRAKEHHKYQLYLNLNIADIDHIKPKQKAFKPMAFVKGSIAPWRKNFTPLHSGKSYTTIWKNFNQTLINGSTFTISSVRIVAVILAKRQCKHLPTAKTWRKTKTLTVFSDQTQAGSAEEQPVGDSLSDENNKALENHQPLSKNYFQSNA